MLFAYFYYKLPHQWRCGVRMGQNENRRKYLKVEQRYLEIKYYSLKAMIRTLARYWKSSNKVVATAEQAIAGVKSGDFLLFGGFGLCGVPMNLIAAMAKTDLKNLTIASNDGGAGDVKGDNAWGLEFLYKNKQVKRMISSYLGFNKHYEYMYLGGEIELQFCPQGTLAEKIRSGGAGIGGFYTRAGVDTMVEKGGIPIKYIPGTQIPEILSEPKPTKVINGKKYLYEETIFADFAFVRAQKADKAGNLIFNKTARNFNQDMAKAAKVVVAEVSEIVENGQIGPDQIHVPGVYVHRIFKADPNSPYSQRKIERLKFNESDKEKISAAQRNVRMKIMKRAAKEVFDGANVNLGIGIPTLLPACLPPGVKINVHAENGVMGVGPYPNRGQQDADLINAGKETITVLPGGSFFSSSESFGIIRGGHLDITMLGALQVSKTGDIANWMIPGKVAKGMGGAMDLVNSGSKVIVVMQHSAEKAKDKARFKLVDTCWLPLTARSKASLVITEKAVFENRDGKLVLTEIAEGLTLDDVQKETDFKIETADTIKTF